nr:CDP-alcohol phosphatidyltransferase family protein [Rhodoligotrophos defluvii]
MTIPNIITIGRILLVPMTVWLIITGQFLFALVAFGAAAVSDAVDGFIAKRFGLTTELGAYLDPLADKLLLVSIYVSLGVLQALPLWLVILVVSRDILIVGAVLLSWLLNKPVQMRPLWISKFNTTAQILLAGVVLGVLALGADVGRLMTVALYVVGAFTVLSGAAYMREWVRHMANGI